MLRFFGAELGVALVAAHVRYSVTFFWFMHPQGAAASSAHSLSCDRSGHRLVTEAATA